MATYGTRDATQFPLPSVESNERYYTLIDADTGKITLKRIIPPPLSFTESLDATVGTIEVSGPNAGKFVPGPGATPTETQAFAQQPQAVQTVKNKATETVTKAKVKGGVSPESAQIQANQLLSPNSGTSPGTTPGDVTAKPIDLDEELKGDDKTRNEFPALIYPEGIGNTKQDVIKFTMLKYEKREFGFTPGQGTDLGGFKPRDSTRKGIGSVVLPIPSGISDTNSVDWGGQTMNPFEAAAANVALTGITQGGAAAMEKAGEITKSTVATSDTKTGLAALFASTAAGVPGILSRTQGAIFNPNLELLFNNVQLRPFVFTFKLSARSDKEAKQIIGIIRFFKQGMAAQKTASNLFLKAPNTFRIQYLYGGQNGKDHPYIGKIKECALQNFSVNYTPEGQYATFNDGVLVSYEISMQFTELEPVFNGDYGKGSGSSGPDSEIGY